MTLPNNRSTLGSNKTGVWAVPHQNDTNAERRRNTQITNNIHFRSALSVADVIAVLLIVTHVILMGLLNTREGKTCT
jgi:hypothetical protein